MPAEENLPCHSVPSMEAGSQMNCASISDTAKSPESTISSNSGSNKHSLSITDLPLTQEKVESYICRCIPRSWKIPRRSLQAEIKTDAVPAKHRPRKVPVHLQEAFHEEVE